MAESGIAPETLAKLEIWWPSGFLGSKPIPKGMVEIPIPAHSEKSSELFSLGFKLLGYRRDKRG